MPTGCTELGNPSGKAQGQPQGCSSESSSCWKLLRSKSKISWGTLRERVASILPLGRSAFLRMLSPLAKAMSGLVQIQEARQKATALVLPGLIVNSQRSIWWPMEAALSKYSNPAIQGARQPLTWAFPTTKDLGKGFQGKGSHKTHPLSLGPESQADEGGGPRKGLSIKPHWNKLEMWRQLIQGFTYNSSYRSKCFLMSNVPIVVLLSEAFLSVMSPHKQWGTSAGCETSVSPPPESMWRQVTASPPMKPKGTWLLRCCSSGNEGVLYFLLPKWYAL